MIISESIACKILINSDCIIIYVSLLSWREQWKTATGVLLTLWQCYVNIPHTHIHHAHTSTQIIMLRIFNDINSSIILSMNLHSVSLLDPGSVSEPEITKIRCQLQRLQNPPFEILSVSTTNSQQSITIQCQEGYFPSEPLTAVCSGNNMWSPNLSNNICSGWLAIYYYKDRVAVQSVWLISCNDCRY